MQKTSKAPEIHSGKSMKPDCLSAEKIKENLRTQIIGREIITLERVTSAMDIAKEMIRDGVVMEGTTIFVEEQLKGRGRSGRRWFCKRGKGLLFTIILKPVIQPEKSPYFLIFFTAVAIVKTIQDMFKLPVEIDWPNDLVVNGKKLGGIIVETLNQAGKPREYIVGIGINVNLKKHEISAQIDQPATSLIIEKERYIDRTGFARALLQNLDVWYLLLREERYEHIVDKWQEFCVNIGRRVHIRKAKEVFTGKLLGISCDGKLTVLLDNGHRQTFNVEHTVMEDYCVK